MGLIKAAISAVGGTLADQWKEYFYCEAMASDVLVQKASKRVNGKSSNTKGSDNVITQGSGIAVADGQCMIIVENGKILDVCAEPGEYTFNISGEPSIFAGDLGTSIKETLSSIGDRIAHGGQPSTDTRVYYFNTKEIIGNKYGTPSPVPFRVVDTNIGLDIDVSIRCNGEYTYKIVDPLLFYTNVCGNVQTAYRKSQLDAQLKTEFVSALAPCIAQVSQLGILPSDVPLHQKEITKSMNAELDDQWANLRGIEVISIAFNPITIPPKDNEIIQKAQQTAFLSNPTMAAGRLVEAQANAMEAAANNENGAMMGFMGMGMAQQAGGMNAQSLFQMGAQQQAAAPAPQAAPQAAADSWTCACGATNTGKFCTECGKGKPAGTPLYRCDKCGWEPEDPANPPKFCPECADPFNDEDIK